MVFNNERLKKKSAESYDTKIYQEESLQKQSDTQKIFIKSITRLYVPDELLILLSSLIRRKQYVHSQILIR
jgi:hypothetical protein